MPLILPSLDNRTFEQLVAEGQAMIPREAPVWTDHNLHDPGITLIELFAWLAEMDLYRLDRTAEASYRAFLRLLGIELRPPRVAQTVLLFNWQTEDGTGLLHARRQMADPSREIFFQTQKALRVSPARLVAVLSASGGELLDHTNQDQIPGQVYSPLGSQPKQGDALYLGFDRPLSEARDLISLYIWTATPVADRKTRERLIAESRMASRATRMCGGGGGSCSRDLNRHYWAQTAWEYYAKPGVWKPLPRVRDKTRALTLSGFVGFAAPAKDEQLNGGIGTPPQNSLYLIRCRLESGGYDCAPVIDRIGINAVAARHAVDVTSEQRSTPSQGMAREVFRLKRAPVVAGSTEVHVKSKDLEVRWREELQWDRIGPHESAYVLSPESGEITFGDGKRGRVPVAKGEIRATYKHGGGIAGNVAAGSLSSIVNGPEGLELSQPLAAFGGAEADTLADAKARAMVSITESQRGVTLADFERLALAAPGLPLARAHALADYHPDTSCMPVAGSVTVIVVPKCSEPRPQPSQEMLGKVKCFLERRRTLTNEVHVVGPSYTTVGVRAQLHIVSGLQAGKIIAQAQAKLDRFFHPLFGGPDEDGWPFGRDVYRTEVMAILNSLPGVTHVDEVTLLIESGEAARCGNLTVCPIGLVSPGRHEVTVFGGGHCQ